MVTSTRPPEISPALNLRSELALLIACGSPRPIAQRQQQIKALIASGLDWTYTLKAAAKHRMLPLLHEGLHQTGVECLPTEVETYLQRSCHVNTLKNLFLDHKLQEILSWYQMSDIPALPYKGPALAKIAYGNLAYRQFTDLDLLVRPEDFKAARALLDQQGFELIADLGWEAHFSSTDQRVKIDLHRSLLPDFFGVSHQVIDPRNPNLTPEDWLLLLSIQLGKDCCHWKVCIRQICDIAALLHRWPELDFESVSSKAKTIGCDRFLAVALILVQDFLGGSLPETMQRYLRHRSIEVKLAQWVSRRIQSDTDHPEVVPDDAGFWYFFRVYNHRFYLQVRERPQDKIFYCFYWIQKLMRMSVCPTQADRQMIKLPAALDFLYVPIHIGRLLWKYGRR